MVFFVIWVDMQKNGVDIKMRVALLNNFKYPSIPFLIIALIDGIFSIGSLSEYNLVRLRN
jgi:hypothetical protein